MKLRQISFKLVSLVMVLAILFSVSATTISAAAQSTEHNHTEENKEINYVSIGDSMANGYGFTGYNQGSDTLDFIGGGEGIYGKNSYPMLFEQYLKDKGYDVEHTKLASSALRAEDLYYLLGGIENPTDDWFGQVNNYTNCDNNAVLQNHYQNAVTNADVITLGIGNASFGAFLMDRLTGLIGVMGSAPEENIYKLDKSLVDKLGEKEKALLYEIYDSASAYIKSALSEEMAAKYPVEDAVELITYTAVNFLVGFRGSVEQIVALNPDAEIILVGLMNTTYGLNLVLENGDKIPFGDYMDELFGLLNAYIVGLPTLLQAEGEMAEAKFFYAEQPNPEFICQVFDDMAALGWDEAACDAATGLSAYTVRSRTLRAYNNSLRYALSAALSMDLPAVTIQDLQIFEAEVAANGFVEYGFYEGYYAAYGDAGLDAAFATGNMDKIVAYVASVYPAKNISIAIALAIEDSVAATCELTDITVDGLENIASPEGLMGVFSPEAMGSIMNLKHPSDLRPALANVLSGEAATDTVKGMCKIYGLFKVGDGMCVHPTPKSHKDLAKSIIENYEYGKIPATVVLEKFGDVYSFADKLGVIGSTPELEVLDEIYTYLDSNDYITDEQTLAILLETYVCIKDEALSSDDLTKIASCAYETLIRNASLSYTDKLAIIGNIYFILKNNEYLTGITALTVVEELYTALAAENLITDEQSYLIVDYVYDVIIDGTVTDADLLNIVRFVYNLLIKGGNARSNDQAKAARTIRVIFAVISETYFNEENQASVEKLITGDNALINDQLLLKIADEALIVLEENQGSDDLTAKLVDTVADTVLNDPNTDPSVKVQIVDEFVKIAENNGALGTEDESVLELKAAGKIYQRLKDAGLLTDAQVMSIITYLYPILVSGEELTDEQVIDIVAYVYDVVFGRDDLTLEDKIDIVVIVYEVLEEEGYVTEENINLVIDAFVDYIENNYEEIYANAHTELRNNGTIAELNAALDAAVEALVVARDVVDSYTVIDTLIEAKARLLKEIDLVDATIAQIKVLINYETITDETLETLEVLLVYLNEHLDNIATLSAQVGTVALDQVVVVLELTDAFIQEFTKAAYAYILENAPVLYEQLVDYLTSAIAEYSHEAAKLAYNWLINNPEKVIGFFDTYGDDIADFIVDYHQIIFGVLGYVGMTYGEDIFYLVLDNADVILPAVAGWFEIHGDLVWDLIVVYFNAIVEYYNLGLDLDFSSPEGIHASLNKIFALLGQLLNMVKDGVYDYLEALGIIEQINKQLAALDAQIRYQINTVIDAINAHVEEKIAEITEYINKQIAILKEQLKNASDELKAEIEKQIEALEKELENLVNAEIENAEDLVAALDQLLQDGTFALGEFIYDAIVAYVNDAIRGEFTPNEETIYVSVNSGDAYYAELLADALANVAKGDITFENTVWGDLNYDLLANADLVTIGYNESELTAFAIAQLLGYVHNYVDGDIRVGADNYLADVYATFDAYITEVKDTFANLGADIDFDFDPYKALVSGEINGIIDVLAGNTTVPAEYKDLLGEEYFELLNMANGLLGDATVSELDWAKYVGEDNLHYVDELRAAIRDELLAQGIVDTYTVEIPVVEYVLDAIFGNNDTIKLDGTIVTLRRDVLESKLAAVANYAITVPVVDTLVFAIESYIYSNVEFNYNYGKLIVDLYEINPDATVILLGHYNAFDFELGFGGESIDLGALYNYVAKINSVQPFAYALLSEKIAYVDISDAETYYESFINAGVDNSLVNFVIAYLNDSTVTDVTEAGNVYIYEQIMSILTLNCDHVYDNACDIDCNKCGAIREVGDHVYVDGVCIHCGAIDPNYTPDTPDAPTHNFHVFDDCNDATCNECNYVRVVIGHVYDDCVDATCYMCDYVREEVPGHVFGICGEDTCERCGKTRPATTHVYNNVCDADCNRCGETREVPEHVYSGCTDVNCNNCGLERDPSAHVIDNKCTDNICNVCGQNVAVAGHVFGAWTVTVEPTRKVEGQQTRTCTGCGLVETATIDALGGIGGGAIAGIVSGSVAVSGAGGFGIYWFLIQKKTFAQLLAALGKGAVATAAVAGEAVAEAGVAAEAGAVAAEAGAEAAAEATAEAAEAAAETIAE